MQEAREDSLTGAVAPKTRNQGQEVLGSPITWLCLSLAKPSWKGGARASSSHSAQAPGEQPRTAEAAGRRASPSVPRAWAVLTPAGDGPHFLPGRGLPLVLNGQGLQTLFLIPQPLAS